VQGSAGAAVRLGVPVPRCHRQALALIADQGWRAAGL